MRRLVAGALIVGFCLGTASAASREDSAACKALEYIRKVTQVYMSSSALADRERKIEDLRDQYLDALSSLPSDLYKRVYEFVYAYDSCVSGLREFCSDARKHYSAVRKACQK